MFFCLTVLVLTVFLKGSRLTHLLHCTSLALYLVVACVILFLYVYTVTGLCCYSNLKWLSPVSQHIHVVRVNFLDGLRLNNQENTTIFKIQNSQKTGKIQRNSDLILTKLKIHMFWLILDIKQTPQVIKKTIL